MFDSSGKIIDGIFSGHAGAYGNIYECMDIYAKNDSSNIGEIRWGVCLKYVWNPIYCLLQLFRGAWFPGTFGFEEKSDKMRQVNT